MRDKKEDIEGAKERERGEGRGKEVVPSPNSTHTSASGFASLAPSAKPPPTPSVPNAPKIFVISL